MKIVLTTLLSFIILFGLVGCTGRNLEDAKFNNIQSIYDEYLLENISEIKVINGDNGERISITSIYR